MTKIYVEKNTLNDEELRTGYVSYKRLIDKYVRNKILCINIVQDDDFQENYLEEIENMFERLDPSLREEYDNDAFEYFGDLEIFQYYITDCNDYDVEQLRDLNNELIVYSNTLDCYILCVTHWGTSWDYVLTSVEWQEY